MGFADGDDLAAFVPLNRSGLLIFDRLHFIGGQLPDLRYVEQAEVGNLD